MGSTELIQLAGLAQSTAASAWAATLATPTACFATTEEDFLVNRST